MKEMRPFYAVAALLLTGTASLAQENQPTQPYQPGQQAPGAFHDATYRRHLGFYIRPDLGFGYMDSNENGVSVHGLAGIAGLAIGGALQENSILAAHFFSASISNPTVSSGGSSFSTNDTSITMFGFGPQYTYYFMPSNMYLSTTLGLTQFHSSSNGGSGDSDWGFGMRLSLGKEWWVGDHWGLGAVGHFGFSTNQDPVSSSSSNTMTTWNFGVAFSATYN
jgi:hypothetical protein